MALIVSASAVWLVHPSTRSLLRGSVLIPVGALIGGERTIGASINFLVNGARGALAATAASLLLAAAFPVAQTWAVAVALFVFTFIVVYHFEHPATFRIALALFSSTNLLARQLVYAGVPYSPFALPLETLACIAAGSAIGTLGTTLLAPVTARAQTRMELEMAMRLAITVETVVLDYIACGLKSLNRGRQPLHCGAGQPVPAPPQLRPPTGPAPPEASVTVGELQEMRQRCRSHLEACEGLSGSLAWELPPDAAGRRLAAAYGQWTHAARKLWQLSEWACIAEADLRAEAVLYEILMQIAGPLTQLLAATKDGMRAGMRCLTSRLRSTRDREAAVAAADRLEACLSRALTALSRARVEHLYGDLKRQRQVAVDGTDAAYSVLWSIVRGAQIVHGALKASAAEIPGPTGPPVPLMRRLVVEVRRRFLACTPGPRAACAKGCARRVKISAQFAVAMTLASVLALWVPDPVNFVGQRAFWGAVTVSFIIEKSPGAAVVKTTNRVLGTVLGSVYGFLAYELGKDHLWSLPLFLLPWIFLTTWIRSARQMQYTGVVAGFTAAIVMLTPVVIGDASAVAFARISYTTYGGVVVLVVTNVLFRRSARRLAREELDACRATLRRLLAATATSFGILGRPGGPTEGEMRAAQDELAKHSEAAAGQLRRLPGLLSEAQAEPSFGGAFPAEAYREALGHLQMALLSAGGVRFSGLWMLSRRMGLTPGLGQRDRQAPFSQSLMVLLGANPAFAAAVRDMDALMQTVLTAGASREPVGNGAPGNGAARLHVTPELAARVSSMKGAFYRFISVHLERASGGGDDFLPGSNCDALSLATMVFAAHRLCTAAARFALVMDRLGARKSRTMGHESVLADLLDGIVAKAPVAVAPPASRARVSTV